MSPGTTEDNNNKKAAKTDDAVMKAPPAVTKPSAKANAPQGSLPAGPGPGAPYAAGVPGPDGVSGPFMPHPSIVPPAYYYPYNIPLGRAPLPATVPPPVQALNNNNNENSSSNIGIETNTTTAVDATTKIRLDHFNNAILNLTANMKRLESVVSKLEGKVNTLEGQLQQANARNEELSILLHRHEAKLLYYETVAERAEGEEEESSSQSQPQTTTQKTAPKENSSGKSNQKTAAAKAKPTIDKKKKQKRPFTKPIKSPPAQSPHDANWEKNFAKLQEYREHAGHCNYSTKNKDDLATFVSTVRRHYRELKQGRLVESLTRERIQRLSALGFEWERVKTNKAAPLPFQERVKQLAEFKAQHGHCNVRQNDPNVPPGLGNFVLEQRKHYKLYMTGGKTKSKSFTQDRINALEALGFQWSMRDVSKEQASKPPGEPKEANSDIVEDMVVTDFV